jgi:hypothetical protein
MKTFFILAALLQAAILSLPPAARAGEGHDHGDAAPAAGGPALPRFAASSEVFELVGVLDGKRLSLYLDRAADNQPVGNARIELEIGGARFEAAPHGQDEYEVELASAPPAGVLPVTATVTVGNEADLLAGELDLHAGETAAQARPARAAYAAWGAGALSMAALAFAARRVAASRRARAGGAA